MISLYLNEMIKILKKKSFLIIIIIAFCFVLLENFVTLQMANIMETLDSYEESHYTSLKEMYDDGERSISFLEEYSQVKTTHDINEFRNSFDKDSWQYAYLDSNENYSDNGLYETLYKINEYELGMSTDKESYEKNKSEYDKTVKIIKDGDWKDIVNIKKEECEKEIKDIDDQIKELDLMSEGMSEKEKADMLKNLNESKNSWKSDLEMINYRLDRDIGYNHPLNYSLVMYYSNKVNADYLSKQDVTKLKNDEYNVYVESKTNEAKYKYYLDNNISYNNNTLTNNEIIQYFFSEYSFIILVFVLMVAGSIVSQEFSKGTIKLLLIKPYKRWKILLSKYFAVLTSIVIMTVILLVMQLIVGGLMLDFESLKVPVFYYSYVGDKVISVNLFTYWFKSFLANMPIWIMIGTLSFAASTLFSNTALAVIVGFAGQTGLSIINSILESRITSYWWAKYFIGFHIDFSPYVFGSKPLIKDFTLCFSSCVWLVYFLILMIVSFVYFIKRDIKNV